MREKKKKTKHNNRDITLPTNVHILKAMDFPVVMYGYESWIIKKAEHWRINAFKLVLEKTLKSPFNCKEIQPISPKGNQSWIFTGRTGAEAAILWPPDAKNWFHGKKTWCWERLRTRGEGDDRGWDGWMVLLTNRHEFEQTPGDSEGQGSLACFSPWGWKVSDMTEQHQQFLDRD